MFWNLVRWIVHRTSSSEGNSGRSCFQTDLMSVWCFLSIQSFRPKWGFSCRRSCSNGPDLQRWWLLGRRLLSLPDCFKVSGGFSGEQKTSLWTASPVCFSVVLNCCWVHVQTQKCQRKETPKIQKWMRERALLQRSAGNPCGSSVHSQRSSSGC